MTETAESVAARLREEIRTGSLAAGAKLPSLTELMAQYDIGRGAAQAALATLRGEGLVYARHGSGWYVQREFARIVRESPRRMSTTSRHAGKAIQDSDTPGRWRDVEVEIDEVPAPEFVAERLGVDVGTPVVRRHRIYAVDERRVQIADSYYLTEVARGTAIVYRNTGEGGVYARLEELGLAPTDFAEELIARPPLPSEVESLDLPRVRPTVLEVIRTASVGEKPVEVNWMLLDAEAYRLVYRFSS